MRLPDTPLRRILGSFVGWLAFTFFFTLLFNAALTVMVQNGGFCAVGGPYDIAEGYVCSDIVTWSMPLAIFGGLGSVVLGVWLSRGFGVPFIAWAWTILFLGLGGAFLLAFLQDGDWGFGISFVIFLLLGAGPIVLGLWGPPRWLVFVGTFSLRGTQFTQKNPPTARDWLLAWSTAIIAGLAGTGLAWAVIATAVGADAA